MGEKGLANSPARALTFQALRATGVAKALAPALSAAAEKAPLTLIESIYEGYKGILMGPPDDRRAALPDTYLGWTQSDDLDHAFNHETGENAHWDSDKGQWSDSKTGKALTTPLLHDTPPAK